MSANTSLNSAFFNPRLYRNILKLWFHDLPRPVSAAPYPVLMRWYGSEVSLEARAAFDAQCGAAGNDALDSIGPARYPLPQISKSSPEKSLSSQIAAPFVAQIIQSEDPAPEETALALMLLLDQLPRNCFRDNQRLIYNHYDRISRSVLREILDRGLDGHERYRDSPPWGLWYYLALTHSEDLQDHKRHMDILLSVKRRMKQKGDAEAVQYVERGIGFEERHKVILEKFGRYPHRNQVLGRESTAEEKEYLDKGGETFGT
ncbi:MAG: hypothetical protein Q9195_007284 [Heterodermia aff. obscurata]